MHIPNKTFLEKKISKVKEYQELFKKAFHNDKKPVKFANIRNVIAAFERKLITPTKFDDYLNGKIML